MGQHQETELKFRVVDLKAVRRRLAELGAARDGRSDEENLIFDDAAGRLAAAGVLLRLRQDQRATLTAKTPVDDPRFKVRRETEVEVSSFDGARALLEALGFGVVASYRKDRETWRLAGAAVLLDELAFGCFVEIEADPDAIERAVGLLGLDLTSGITLSYLDLQAESRR